MDMQARKRVLRKRPGQITSLVRAAKRREYVRFDNLTPSQVRKLARELEKAFGVNFLHMHDRQNYGPSIESALKVASKYKGRLIGYIISPIRGRDDYRITIDGVGLPKETAYKHLRELDYYKKPDDVYKRGKYIYFWWD